MTPATAAEAAHPGVVWDQPVGLPEQMPLGDDPAQNYQILCASCHGANLAGGTHGSLLDGEWTYAQSPADLQTIVDNGLPDRGMPGVRPLMPNDRRQDLVRWLASQIPADAQPQGQANSATD